MAADAIVDVEELEDRLSEPPEEVVQTMRRMQGDLLLLGVGGKRGPTLARMARRASDAARVARRILGVARFSTPTLGERLQRQGIETITCDLLDRSQFDRLPEAANVLFMAGMKFGATGHEAATWAINAYLPGMVCEKYRRSRIVAFSTGNVYGMVPVDQTGSREDDLPLPHGEYAMSCLGRERVFSYFSQTLRIPVAIVRLNYAHELRYGVLVDIAVQVLRQQPVDLTMGYFNAIWQRDANAMALRAFDHVIAPPLVVNVAGPERLSVRAAAEQFGRLLGKPVRFAGVEAPDALLSDGQRGYQLLGDPSVDSQQMIQWIAAWLLRGGPTLNKPTHFQVRDGKF